MRVDASGSIESIPAPDGAADLTLTISPFAVPAFVADPKRWDELVGAEGDAALAATLKGPGRNAAVVSSSAPLPKRSGRWQANFSRTPAAGCWAFPGYAGTRVATACRATCATKFRWRRP
jgi:hypothetical protein